MSFFGTTFLGTQGYFKDSSVLSQNDPLRSHRELGYLALPPLPKKSFQAECEEKPHATAFDIDSFQEPDLGHQDSLIEMNRRKTKHIRSSEGPLELYQHTVTTAQNYGWYHKLQASEPWTYVKRYPQKENEMTKFVSYMKLNQKDFVLF